MVEIIIPTGGRRDGWVFYSVNGRERWIRAGVPTVVADSALEVFDHAYINYSPWPIPGSPGSGDPPAWAPAGSVAYVDFVTNEPRAWTSTGGEVLFANLNTILGDSTLIPNRAYNPAKVDLGVGYGLGGGDQGPGSFLNDMVTAFNFNFTCLVEFNGNLSLEYVEPTFGTDLIIAAGIAGFGDIMSISDQNSPAYLQKTGGGPADAISKLAFTLTPTQLYAAYNGVSMDDADVPPNTVVDPVTPNQPTDIVFIAAKLKRLTIYNPIKTAAELVTLTS